MKRFIVLLLTVFMMLAPVAAFADAAGPSIDQFNVYVGPDGFDYIEFEWVNGSNVATEKHAEMELGTKITIVDQYDVYWIGMIEGKEASEYYQFTDEQFKKLIQEKQVLLPDFIGKDAEIVKAVVHTDDNGLYLRFGPSQNFGIIQMMPEGSSISYDHVYKNWAYVDFKGERGWASLDYIEPVEEPETPSGTEGGASGSTEAATAGSQSSAPEQTTEPEPVGPEKDDGKTEIAEKTGSSFFETKGFLILAACLLVALTATVTAIIVLKVMSRRKGKH
ncbi:MAG: SH3 domain-containing protein [Firmicutes bacterium]|nr:SH3 domain-containing protein [Bacillota bacterium]